MLRLTIALTPWLRPLFSSAPTSDAGVGPGHLMLYRPLESQRTALGLCSWEDLRSDLYTGPLHELFPITHTSASEYPPRPLMGHDNAHEKHPPC
ncbi:unnamed protein product [Prunus armeniaca]|uniref:Secreted protein n=1 Tax=Prunus armeniaca TaxID=36596 RepID=A0A6J5W1S7_PRUAR|nr:unnamed protein product [Prunus armeniaca]